jgi:hypothetical protein
MDNLRDGEKNTSGQTYGQIDERIDGWTNTERGCRIGLANYRCRMSCQTDRRTHVVNLYIRFIKKMHCDENDLNILIEYIVLKGTYNIA